MEMLSRLPSEPLRGHAERLHAYREEVGAPRTHRGVPSPWLTMVLSFEEPVRVVEPTGVRELRSVLGGLHTAPVLMAHAGRQAGVQIGLGPLGARSLLGIPAGELTGEVLSVEDVLPGADGLCERLAEAGDWAERFRLVEGFLLRRLRPRQAVDGEVAWAWRRLHRTGGAARVEDLAGETGWSTRYLRRRFHEQIGLPPKAAGRVIRFDRARTELRRRLAEGGALGLADVAHGCGYADQAHLTREFRALAGASPARYLADEFGEGFRFVQDE